MTGLSASQICRDSIRGLLLCVLLSHAAFAADSGKDTQAPLSWQGYLDLLKDNSDLLELSTVAESRDMLPQYLFMTIAHAYPIFASANPDWPEFVTYINHILNIAGPNPDVTYYFATIAGDNTYRIVGERGTVHMIEFTTGYDWTGFKDKLGVAQSASSLDDFTINPDGSFEIILGGPKPDLQGINWIPLDEQANFLFVRQVAYAPEEINARMAIEKLSGPEHNLPDSDALLKSMINYVKNNARQYLRLVDEFDNKGIYNRFIAPDYSAIGGVKNQVYQSGLYEVAEDEALVITVAVPQCTYWNLQASDLLWQTEDYLRVQNSLNGHVDRSDSDGQSRFVLSHRDPGVENWIDLNDQVKGYMLFRWVNCDQKVSPHVRKIPIERVAEILPVDTRKVTPEERQENLKKMSTAMQLRRNW
jgi:hypothetical protein